MCGRCDSTVSSCDRDPSEHSFGLASQCSSCPNGWVRCFYYTVNTCVVAVIVRSLPVTEILLNTVLVSPLSVVVVLMDG